MKRYYAFFLILAVTSTACGAQDSTPNGVVEFGNILAPHYQSALNNIKCNNGRDVTIPLFDGQSQTISFSYDLCRDDTEAEIVNFTHKSMFAPSKDYVIAKYKTLTPEAVFSINPEAQKYTYLDIPIFGVVKLEGLSPETYLKSRKRIHKIDWSICEIKKWDENIWGLENPSFKEIPAETYTIGNYASFSEWKLNHEADEVKYREEFGKQKLKNRACGNEQHYWHVAKDEIMITIPNPANFAGGVDPTKITYTDSR